MSGSVFERLCLLTVAPILPIVSNTMHCVFALSAFAHAAAAAAARCALAE